MKNTFTIVMLTYSLLLIGCQSLGEDIAELRLSEENIVSTKTIELKKDEKVTIWTKCEVEFKNPDFKIKYLIEENNKQIEFDSLSFFANESNKIIRSSATKEDVVEKNYDDKDTIIHKENFNFELKGKEFIAPKDGKYSFDFKLAKKSELGSSFGNNFTIILRK